MTSPNPVGEIKLLPCPFCESTDVRIEEEQIVHYKIFWVYCDDCDARGPRSRENKDWAIEQWNTRVNASQSKVGDGEHKRRVVGHVSGWQEQMSTCVCGKPWPCPDLRTQPPAGESAGESADALPSGSLDESIKSAQRQLANTPAWLKPVEREVGEVKRYDFEVDHAVDGAYRVESPTGEFVLASDYDALLARLRGGVAVERDVRFERTAYCLSQMMLAYERRVRSDCKSQEEIDKRPWECAEYVAASEYLRKVWPSAEDKLAEAALSSSCPTCGGSGRVPFSEVLSDDGEEYAVGVGTKPCPSCSGK